MSSSANNAPAQPGVAGTVAPQVAVSPAAKNTPKPSRGRGRGRGGKQRAEARSMFDPVAAKQGMERYFSEWQAEKRSNVEVHLTTDLPARLAQPYCEHARSYVFHRGLDEETASDAVHATSALTHFLAAFKMLKALPQSEIDAVRDLYHLRQVELHGPAVLISLFDHLGKFDNAVNHVRVAYATLMLKRWFLGGIQQLALHNSAIPEWTVVSAPQVITDLIDKDLNKIVFPDNDSVKWIRDSAVNLLRIELDRTYDVSINPQGGGGPHTITMSNPHLDFSDVYEKQKSNVIAWLGNITQHNPGFQNLIGAGLMTIITVEWLRRPHSLLQDLEPTLPAAVHGLRVSYLLGFFQLSIPYYPKNNYAQASLLREFPDHVSRCYGYLQDTAMALFKAVFNIQKQPENPFGDEAQLVPVPLDQRKDTPRIDFKGTFAAIPNDPAARVIEKIDNRSLTALGLTFGFSEKVLHKPVFVGRLNSGSHAVSRQHIGEDKKTYF